jgi:enoyl-CoA hydratase
MNTGHFMSAGHVVNTDREDAAVTDYEFIDLDVQDGIALVRLNRPPVNALSIGLYHEIARVFGEVDDRADEVRVVVFTGAGKHFCGGRDLKTSASEDPEERARAVKAALGAIYHARVPVIGAVNGGAVGVGLICAILCDFLVASERAFFVMPEIDAGANPSVATALRGLNQFQARAMAFTGERYSPDEFYRMGVLRKVVPHDELMPEALRLAGLVAAKSPMAMQLAKWSANEVEALFADFEQAYRAIESRVSAVTLHTADAKAAAAAFADKRGPLAERSA